jgi:hypothetical protein
MDIEHIIIHEIKKKMTSLKFTNFSQMHKTKLFQIIHLINTII